MRDQLPGTRNLSGVSRFVELPRLALVVGAFAVICALASASAAVPRRSGRARITTSFDQNWKFLKSDASSAEKPEFNDSGWRTVDVPHDWSIEGPFDLANSTGRAQGFLPAGIGWYRKRFLLPECYAGRRVFIDFDGVMANSHIWINGEYLGTRPYGYVSFRYELTGKLNFGKEANVIAVRADNSGQPASRWYAGAGIYRHVRLVISDPVHLDHYGVFVTTPSIKAQEATVHVQSRVVNQSTSPRQIVLQVTVVDRNGKAVQKNSSAPQTINPGQAASFDQDLAVVSPIRWDIDRPYLYRALVQVLARSKLVDDEEVAFGIREVRFDAGTGFWLNERSLKIKGVCLHHDGGALGAAVPLGTWRRRLEELRKLGVNAIRTAHNPPAPEFLNLTDEMGFLVMDELFDAWTVRKNPFDYHLYFRDWSIADTADTVQRDRNHASVIIYSAGNEIHDTPKPELAKPILASLLAAFHQYDPSRPVTQALFRPNVSHDYDNGLADMLDVVGQNYRENEILAAHQARPERKILGTENKHDLATWLPLRDNAPYAGQFLWAGIDYLGESPGWPYISRDLALLDRTGRSRPRGLQRQSWWSETPMVFITRRVAPQQAVPIDPGYGPEEKRQWQTLFPDWTPPERAPHIENVEVYSNCEEVELLLNGRSQGAKSRPADDAPRTWMVPFEAGTLKAIGKNQGRIVATHELQTAGEPVRILLTVDRQKLAPVWDDVAYVSATVVDHKGVRVPNASNLITFKTSGAGVVVAVDNADVASHEPFQGDQRHAYQGQCVAIVKATRAGGPITITASSPRIIRGKVSVSTIVAAAN